MFELSCNTHLHILQSKFNSDKYLKLVRLGKNAEKKERWLNFAASTWESIETTAQHITAELENFDGSGECEKSFEINEKTTLKISKFRGLLYVGFCQVNGDFTNRINLNTDEWKKLIAVLQKVKKMLLHVPEPIKEKKKRPRATATSQGRNKKKKKKNEKCTSPKPCSSSGITKYQWVILGNDGLERDRPERWYFIEETCKQDGIAHLENDEEILLIDSQTEAPPAPLDLLELVYAYLVQENAQQISVEKCHGCQTSHPSQREHMSAGGCLSEQMEKTEYYMEDALAKVDVSQAVDIITKVYNRFDIPVDVMFIQPVNLPEVTIADLCNCYKGDNEDFYELFKSG